MRCYYCGAQLSDGQKYCTQCGGYSGKEEFNSSEKVHKRKKIIEIIVVILVLLLIAASIVVVIVTREKDDEVDVTNNKIEAITDVTAAKPNVDDETEADIYYKENAKVILKEGAEYSDFLITGKEAVKMLEERGFDASSLTAYHNASGEYFPEGVAITSEDNNKYPAFTTYYCTESGEIWTINITGNKLTAYPISILLNTGAEIEILVTETDTLLSYDASCNVLYESIPNEDTVITFKEKLITPEMFSEYNAERLGLE